MTGMRKTKTELIEELKNLNEENADLRQLDEELAVSLGQLRVTNEELIQANEKLKEEMEARAKAEEEAQSLARFSLENPNPMMRVDYDGTLLYANPASEDFLKHLNASVGELIPDELREILETASKGSACLIKDVSCGGRVFALTMAPVPEANYINIYGSDVTERRQAAQALLESEKMYRTLSEDQPAPVCTFLPDTTLTYVNRAFCEFFEKPFQDLVGQKFIEFLPADEGDWLQDIIRSLSPENPKITHVNKFHKNGEAFWFEWSNRAFFNVLGEVVKYQAVGFDYTKRKRAEDELKISIERYRLLVETATEGIVAIDPDEVITFANQALADMLRYDISELVGRKITNFLFPEELEAQKKTMRERKAGKDSIYERRWRRKDGSELWTIISGKTLTDDKGEFSGAFGMLTDITERKRAEEELNKSNERYRLLVETANEGIIALDADQTITFANQALANMLGYDLAEIIGSKVLKFHFPDDSASHEERMRARRTGKDETYERRLKRKDGSEVWMIISAKALKDENGVFAGSFAMLTDITESKKAQESIKASETTLREILRLIRIAIIVIDPSNGCIVDVNSVAESIFRKSKESLIGCRSMEAILPLLELKDEKFEVTEMFLHSKVKNRELVVNNPEGSAIPVIWNTLEFNRQGRRYWANIFIDITDRKALERQLTHAQKMESIGSLAAGIAHEINTPTQYVSDNTHFLADCFTDVLGLLDKSLLVADKYAESVGRDDLALGVASCREEIDLDYLKDEIPKSIEQSLEGLDRITTIVKAMRRFSHPGGAEMKQVDLNDALKNTLIVCRNEWKYVAEVDEKLAPSIEPIRGFPDDLNQVFLNVIVNAAHAIAEKVEGTSETGLITVSTHASDGWAEVRVTDTGDGIPEKYRNRIFDPFFTTKTLGKGTGQGMAIAYSIVVDKHKGEIFFETKEGEGTTFFIRLPAS